MGRTAAARTEAGWPWRGFLLLHGGRLAMSSVVGVSIMSSFSTALSLFTEKRRGEHARGMTIFGAAAQHAPSCAGVLAWDSLDSHADRRTPHGAFRLRSGLGCAGPLITRSFSARAWPGC